MERVVWRAADYWTWVEYTGDLSLFRLRDQWHAFNAEHFGGSLMLPHIERLPPMGDWRGGDYSLSLGIIRLEVDGLAWSSVTGSLLHEMVHQYTFDEVAEHGRRFTRQCNVIGARLGLAPVRKRDAPCWPHH